MRKILIVFYTILLIFFIFSCEDHLSKVEKYQRPDFLEGKVYDVIHNISELTTFDTCLKITQLDKLINTSGLYTVMAPTNSAFEAYILENPEYNSVFDIDSISLRRLLEFHIIKMSYSKDQLRSLNTSGWIDVNEEDPVYSGYKRETMYHPENRVIKVNVENGQASYTSSGGETRTIYSETNKFAPLFFQEYMDFKRLIPSDYKFYFDRDFEAPEIFFGPSKLMQLDTDGDGTEEEVHPAENGFVYLVDRVVKPMNNAYEALLDESTTINGYDRFGELVNVFAEFLYNAEATNSQEGANEGLEVEKLYDLEYTTLPFDLLKEATNDATQTSIAFHNAIFAPTNEAYSEFMSNVLLGEGRYTTLKDVPNMIKRAIVRNHMKSGTAYYESLAEDGLFSTANGEMLNLVNINSVEVQYGSNATFVGLDRVLIPGMLTTVTAPVALRKTYSDFLWALYFTNTLEILNYPGSEYTLFPIDNESFFSDTSLVIDVNDGSFNEPRFEAKIWDKSMERFYSLRARAGSDLSLSRLVQGQVALGIHKGNCRKEFLRNLNLYYIEINNETQGVSGGLPSSVGYNGFEPLDQFIDEELTDDLGLYGTAPSNGNVFPVETWFSFPQSYFSNKSMNINGNSRFVELFDEAGLIDNNNHLSFLEEGEVLTVFVPTDAALDSIRADTLSTADLSELLKAHFVVVPSPLFTDNVNRNPFETSYFTKAGRQMKIITSSPNEINILKADGSDFITLEEDDRRTNKMYLGWDNSDDSDGNTGANKLLSGIAVVVHQINAVIEPEQVFEN